MPNKFSLSAIAVILFILLVGVIVIAIVGTVFGVVVIIGLLLSFFLYRNFSSKNKS